MGGFQLHTAEWVNLTSVVVNTKEARHQAVYTVLFVRFQAKLACAVITSRDNKLTPGGWQPWKRGELERRDQDELLCKQLTFYLFLWCWFHGWVQIVKIYWTYVHLRYEYFCICIFSSVQSLSFVGLFVTPWSAACRASLCITNSWSLLKLMSSSWWCQPTISSSVIPFSSCLQSFPASGSFPVSQFFA